MYEQEGQQWFRSTQLADDKDRVMVRRDGRHTYFAADAAYHHRKWSSGYQQVIDIFGADHHGYVPRLQAVQAALGHQSTQFSVSLVQFAVLFRGKEKVAMSTRSGEFITLKTLIDEVGRDATRFFYLMRKSEQHMDFDIELAKEQSNENPVYYVQYAHARIASVLRQADCGWPFLFAKEIDRAQCVIAPIPWLTCALCRGACGISVG